MVILKGDIHGHVNELIEFIEEFGLSDKDTIIVLGDVGLNYYNNKTDRNSKRKLFNTGVNFFCIHGNHEIRPQNLETYVESNYWGGKVLIERDYPNILFPIDGEIFNIPTSKGVKKSIVIGGAYSVDKYYRLARGLLIHSGHAPHITNMEYNAIALAAEGSIPDKQFLNNVVDKIAKDFKLSTSCSWWKDELPSKETLLHIDKCLDSLDWKIDIVLSHTCPFKYMPFEAFLPGLNQDLVDNSMEQWLDVIEDKLSYENWFCGHFHIEKDIDKLHFLFHNFVEL